MPSGGGDTGINWLLLYLEIAAFFLVFYAFAYLSFFRKIRRSGKAEFMQGSKVYKDTKAGPGSIWTSIFFPGKEVNPVILRHELAHISAGHRYDLLLLQILSSLFWLNPFYWLLYRELKNVHEYEADSISCHDLSAEQYAELLLSQHFKSSFNIAHSFFHHPLKRRIIMIQQRNRLAQSGRTTLIAVALSLSVGVAAVFAQNKHAKQEKPAQNKAVQEEMVYKFAEKMPKFKGSWQNYLSANVHYPDSARARGEEGRCIVQFVVAKEGTVKDVRVVRSSNFLELDGEAVRAVATMPAWIPGEQDGKKVAVYFTLPITFKLE